MTILLCHKQVKARGQYCLDSELNQSLSVRPCVPSKKSHYLCSDSTYNPVLGHSSQKQVYSHNWCSFMTNWRATFRVQSFSPLFFFYFGNVGCCPALCCILLMPKKTNKQRGRPFTSCTLADSVRLKLTSGTVFLFYVFFYKYMSIFQFTYLSHLNSSQNVMLLLLL